ncbi:hypothetical protein KEM56_006860 [Ascosphaera pollenicola]|nr:hypothetical protein KEM56_006860 [Ascosphaera pollenicola]
MSPGCHPDVTLPSFAAHFRLRPSSTSRQRRRKHEQTVLGPGDVIAERDSQILYGLPFPEDAFDLLRSEVNWQNMYHHAGPVPRLVAVQGDVLPDGSMPIYRHPADESPPLNPFTSTVAHVRHVVEKQIGQKLNHVLIQLYRSGHDSISEHSDKTLDVVRGSTICNVSFGAQRTMCLRTKRSAKLQDISSRQYADLTEGGRRVQRVPLPHHSLFIWGPDSNMRWLHGINPDKRLDHEKAPAELDFDGVRISLTFRHIGTFMNPDTNVIWGQGAVSKTLDAAQQIIHGDEQEATKILRGFSNENRQTEFDWDAAYGCGFNIVNFETVETLKLVLSGNEVTDLRLVMSMLEFGLRYEIVRSCDLPQDAKPSVASLNLQNVGAAEERRPFASVGNNVSPGLKGELDILVHILEHTKIHTGKPTRDDLSSIISQSNRLWQDRAILNSAQSLFLNEFEELLRIQKTSFIDGDVYSYKDCVLWPALRFAFGKFKRHPRYIALDHSKYPLLGAYYQRIGRRGCVREALRDLFDEH